MFVSRLSILTIVLTATLIAAPGCGKGEGQPKKGGDSPLDPPKDLTMKELAELKELFRDSTPEPKDVFKDDKGVPPKVLQATISLEHELDYAPSGLALSPDRKTLVVAAATKAKGKNVQIWNLNKRMKVHEFDESTSVRIRVAMSPDGRTAAIPSHSGSCIKLIDVVTGKVEHELRPSERELAPYVTGPFFSPKGDIVIVGSDRRIFGWETSTGKEKFVWEVAEDIWNIAGFFDEGRRVATGHNKLVIKVWDVTTGKQIQTMSYPLDERFLCLAVSSDGSRIASLQASILSPVYLWDVKAGKREKKLPIQPSSVYSNIQFLPDNNTVVYHTNKHHILCVNIVTGRATHELRGHTKEIGSFTVTSDGRWLASASDDGTIKVWELAAP